MSYLKILKIIFTSFYSKFECDVIYFSHANMDITYILVKLEVSLY